MVFLQNPVATAFEIFWMIFEPILFGLTGTQIKIREMEGHTVAIGISILIVGILVSKIELVIHYCKRHWPAFYLICVCLHAL